LIAGKNKIKMEVQRENAFQKQPTIFVGNRRVLGRKVKGRKTTRYWKNVGLGIKTPKTAIEGDYIDKKCPFTGNVSIRGRILRGVVASVKMERTLIVRRDYLHYVPKYDRYEKRHKNIPVHLSPAFEAVKVGDIVTIGECRPLSKTVRFNVLKVEHQTTQGLQKKKQFRIF
jgi:small subunit ribosomal protein S11e